MPLNISAQEELKEVNFDEKFKTQNQRKAIIEIDEVKELIHIMIAITEAGLENEDMVEQKGVYYKDVLKHFEPYKDDQIILDFDSLMKTNPLNYVFLTGNALSYNFKRNRLVPDNNYLFPAQGVANTTITENPITTYKKDIERFAKKTKFKKFYKQNSNLYSKIISDYNKLANLQEQWNWLEKNFDSRMNNYAIMCSPLIRGLNYTTTYTDNDFTQIMMVLPPIEIIADKTEKENIVFNTRFMFTEIDHNYVSKPTEQHEELINVALQDREKWVDINKEGTEYYPNPVKVFGEYITFATYYLFCIDKFQDDNKTIQYAYDDINSLLQNRGFPKIQEFNDELLRLRKKYPNKKIDDLYPDLIEWCKKQ